MAPPRRAAEGARSSRYTAPIRRPHDASVPPSESESATPSLKGAPARAGGGGAVASGAPPASAVALPASARRSEAVAVAIFTRTSITTHGTPAHGVMGTPDRFIPCRMTGRVTYTHGVSAPAKTRTPP